MNTFDGIAISETRLLTQNIIMSVLLLGLLVAAGFWLASCIKKSDVKGNKRKRNLRKRAKTDPAAEQELARLKRKKRNQRKRNAKSIVGSVCLGVIIAALAVTIALLFVLPGWIDFAIKDYMVYNGEFEVSRGNKLNYIDLDDGTELYGGGGLDVGEYNGRVVYSKRTHITMGAEK